MRKSLMAFCVPALLLGLFAGVELRNALVQGTATLDVEAMITKGSVFRIYYNNNFAQPKTAAIRQGEWTHYTIEVPSRITALRLDPSDTAGAQIYIRSIVLSAAGKNPQRIDLSLVKTWSGPHITAAEDPATNSLRLTTDAPDAYLMGSADVTVPTGSAFLSEHFRLDGDTLLASFLAAAAIILLVGIRREHLGTVALTAAVIVLGLFLGRTLASYLLGSFHGPPLPVNHAVGLGGYFGLSLSGEYFTANLSISIGLVLALIAGLAWIRMRTGKWLPDLRSVENSQPVNLWIFGIFSLLLAVFLFPPLANSLNQPIGDRVLVDSDSQTVFSWQYLVYHGALPWRDFWFPYGGFADRLAPAYPYFLYDFANELLLMGVLIWSALKIWSNRWGIVAGVCFLYLVLGVSQVFSLLAGERYLLSLSVILLCAVTAKEATSKYFVAFGLWCAYVVTQEASQLVYAVPASIVLLLAAVAGADGAASRMRMIRRIVVGGAVASGGILAYFAFLLSRSQLGGWLEFMTTLNDSAAYSAGRAPLANWISSNGELHSLFLISLGALLMGGVLNLACRKSLSDLYLFLPLCLGLLSWVLLQKEILRSGVITQILPYPIIGLTILLFQARASIANRWPTVALSFSLALIFGCFVMDARVADPLRGRLDQFEKFPSHISAAFFHSSDWERTTADYFSPEHFQFGDISGAELKSQLSAAAPVGPNDTFYVLGNNSEIYALFGKMAPYSIYLYNMSPLDLQLRTTSWLEEKRAKYVFWDVVHNGFDGVPNEVRLPVVYRYIVEHYKLTSANPRYRILERLADGEKPNLDSWYGLLGPSVDLGYIPSASALTETSKGSVATSAVLVHVPQPANNAKATINLMVNGQPYTVLFTETKEKANYILRLDRIPLIAAAISSGASVQLGGNGNLTVDIRRISVSKNDLY